MSCPEGQINVLGVCVPSPTTQTQGNIVCPAPYTIVNNQCILLSPLTSSLPTQLANIELRVVPNDAGTLFAFQLFGQGQWSTTSTKVIALAIGIEASFGANPATGFRLINLTGPGGISTTQNPFSAGLITSNGFVQANFEPISGLIPTEIRSFIVDRANGSAPLSVIVSGMLHRRDTGLPLSAGHRIDIAINTLAVTSLQTISDGSFTASLTFNIPGTYLVTAVFTGE